MGSLNGQNNHSSLPAAHDCLLERITALLSRWHGLQMAVQNQWGGHDSFQKSQQLAADIFSWFIHSKAPQIEDLKNLLHERMLLSLNTEIEDGSIEEVNTHILSMLHENL
ncbi:hypothetical protein V6N13_135840 [Hibiscus sabdariffa]